MLLDGDVIGSGSLSFTLVVTTWMAGVNQGEELLFPLFVFIDDRLPRIVDAGNIRVENGVENV